MSLIIYILFPFFYKSKNVVFFMQLNKIDFEEVKSINYA